MVSAIAARRLRVARNIAQRFAIDMEDGCRNLLLQVEAGRIVQRQLAGNAGALLPMMQVPFDGWRKAQRIEQHRFQLGRKPPGPAAAGVLIGFVAALGQKTRRHGLLD